MLRKDSIPQYTGPIGTGGFAQHSSFAPTPDTMHFVLGKRAFFGYYISSCGELYWFANILQREPPSRGDLDTIASEEWQERMLDLFREDMPLISGSILSSPFFSDQRASDAPQSRAASEGHSKL